VRELIEKGLIYPQSLSSMLVPLLLGPKSGEYILDMCAAPGSKASQIFALMKGEQGEQSEQSERNEGQLTCLESVRKRFYKLKAVLSLLGASSVTCCLTDARKFDPKMQVFDKILLDAPCSAEGRFSLKESKSFAFWSIRKIHEMAYKQKGLLLHASRLLKPEGRLIYSTCTLAPEENEEAIDWLLRKTGGALSVVPLKFKGFGDIATYPCLTQWGKKTYHASIRECLRICPTREMEGFFIAQLQKVSSFVRS
jgi:16S rRNA (cytosine1407-C5)-methyltransferase